MDKTPAKRPRARFDPGRDGPRVFDSHPGRLRIAAACTDPLPAARLAEVSGQEDANARTTAKTLKGYGVLESVRVGAKGQSGYRLRAEWRPAVEEARLRASKGSLGEGQMAFLIERGSVAAIYGLLADQDRPDRRLAWASRLPHHSQFGLLLAIDPDLSEDEIERLSSELEQAGVRHQRLSIGRMASAQQLRELAASSLPGAFGEEN
jgi:hypothetical protein